MTDGTILLVDDSPDDVELTRLSLLNNRISNPVAVARDGAEALDLLAGGGPMPVLVLLDLKLPRVNGLEVLAKMRSDPRTRRIPVVVISTSGELNDVATAYDLGCNGYIRKPVDFDEFDRALRQLAEYWLDLNVPPPA